MLYEEGIRWIYEELKIAIKKREKKQIRGMSQKSGFLIVSNGFFIENVGTYWPLDLLQSLSIWLIKATTEESFSLTRTKPHSLREGIGLIT